MLGINDNDQLSEYNRNWVEKVLKNGSNQRELKWTENIAVGDKEFVRETKAKLGAKAIGRKELKIVKDMNLRSPKAFTTVFLALKSAAYG